MTGAIVSPAVFEQLRTSHALGSLLQRRVGLVDSLHRLRLRVGEYDAEVLGASMGALGSLFSHVPPGETRGGAGSDHTVSEAWVKALVETAERYATMAYDERDFIVGTAASFGSDALDLASIPRCSAAELSDPLCPVRLPQDSVPIRWVPGWSLTYSEPRLVPAVMTHLHLDPWASERFWMQTSTGVAAHTSLEAALVAAICEVIERDALALTWLGRIPLPPVSFDAADVRVQEIGRRSGQARVEFRAFDATTDLGVPTVLSVHLRDGHPTCDLTVSCATSLDPVHAFRKTFLEATSVRVALDAPLAVPGSVDDFVELEHGARYFGAGGRRGDLAFLLQGRRAAHTLTTDGAHLAPPEALGRLVAILRERGLEAVAIDLSTDELRCAGLWVVRVVIPGLLPVSFVHRARHLGTPRLYDYVATVRGPLDEADVNPSPIPFA